MGKDKDKDADETRRRILDGAFEVMDEAGLHNLTLKAVALQSDVAISLISYHFGSKEKLLLACAERWAEILTPLIGELFAVANDETLSPKDTLEKVVSAALDTARQHPLPMRVMLRQLVATGEVPEAISELSLANLDSVERLITQRIGVPGIAARAVAHQASHLIIRMGICSPDELEAVYQTDAESAWLQCKKYVCSSVYGSLIVHANEDAD